MSLSACLIFNPVAGQGDPDQDLKLIQSILEPAIALDIRMTSESESPGTLAQAALNEGFPMILASGGDGTISSVAAAILGTETPLGVISRGTANAFANALSIPTEIEGACKTILEGNTRAVDIARCNGLPMVLLAGVGFEAEMVALASREAKNRLGVLAYILAGLEQLQNFQPFEIEIETEDKIIKATAAAVTIANAAPATSILAQGPAGVVYDDGFLDLTIVAPMNIRGAIAASYHLLSTALRGNAVQRQDIGYLRAKQFRVTADPPQKVVLDGEIIGMTPIDVECIPQGLTIFSPLLEEPQQVEKLEGLPNLTVEVKESET